MNKFLMAGVIIVNMALILYSTAFIVFYRRKKLSRSLLFLFSLGLFADVVSTCCMVAGSPHSPYTYHGFVGYSALAVMIVEVTILWSLFRKTGYGNIQSSRVIRYTVFSYIWWVIAYITGVLIVSLA